MITYIIVLPICIAALVFFISSGPEGSSSVSKPRYFDIQSIDTMQDSRDRAREAESDPAFASTTIENDMSLIAASGANYVAIDTPYDPEFTPVLEEWVRAARAHGLSIWFRGNFSGWEGWFDYASITPQEHLSMLQDFISSNPDLFQNGDIFTPCPECENGGPGDPRTTGNAQAYDQFLVDEYHASENSFDAIGKDVAVYTSMNEDIADEIITPQVAHDLGGTILIDHYTASPDDYPQVVEMLSQKLGAKIGIGEFGAPIPDINGSMTDDEQATFIGNALALLARDRSIVPIVNYWSISNSSTALTDQNGDPKEAYATVAAYFKPIDLSGVVKDPIGTSVSGAEISINGVSASTTSSENGSYDVLVPDIENGADVEFSKTDWSGTSTLIRAQSATTTSVERDIVLAPSSPDVWYDIESFIHNIL